MARLLLITHRSPSQAGGPTARWRSFLRELPKSGWDIDVLNAPSHLTSSEFAAHDRARRAIALRAQLMSRLRGLLAPLFKLAGSQPLPLSTLWMARGVLEARRRLVRCDYDVVLATAPPMVALLVARLAVRAFRVPLVIEFRDLWAGNPAYDLGGPALNRLEAWILRAAQAVVVCTPEAATDLRARHPGLADRVRVVPNGFDSGLLERRQAHRPAVKDMLEILHSGTLTLDRPLTPILRVLEREPYRSRIRLVLHGYLVPELAREARAAAERCNVEIVPPSSWDDAVARMAASDVALVTQAASAGDATAVASKVYEYLALGKPVLCVTDGGATETLLRRLGASRWCARLDNEHAIAAALDDLLADHAVPPVPRDNLAPYERQRLAGEMRHLLEEVASVRAAAPTEPLESLCHR